MHPRGSSFSTLVLRGSLEGRVWIFIFIFIFILLRGGKEGVNFIGQLLFLSES
jgi:hypothetical protein